MVRLHQIRHTYGPTLALDLRQFEAQQGEHWLVLGLSGSGKTTLLHILGGLLQPSQGTVVVADQDLAELRGDALDRFRGTTIGIVFQESHLLPTLTVEQNLLLAPYMAGLPQDQDRVREVLQHLDVAEKVGAYPDELSMGQRQRVGIARAVMNRPRLLLVDEPTSSLDDVRSAQVLDLLIREAEAIGATLIVTTHDRRVKQRFGHQLELTPPVSA